MPFKLKITSDDIKSELESMGYTDIDEEAVIKLKKDVLKLIKKDVERYKERKNANSIPNVPEDEIDYQKYSNDQLITSTPLPESLNHKHTRNKRSTSTELSNFSEESGYSDSELYSNTVSESTGSSQTISGVYDDTNSNITNKLLMKCNQPHTAECKDDNYGVKPVKSKGALNKFKKDTLPKYPKKVDPVNLYHFYRAHWDKFKVPGEDPRSELRWDIRTKLFYSE